MSDRLKGLTVQCPTKIPSWSDQTNYGQTRPKMQDLLKVGFYSSLLCMIKNDILPNFSWDFVRLEQILVSQCPITDCYLQPCLMLKNMTHCPWTALEPE